MNESIIRVLLIEDDLGDVRLIKEFLSEVKTSKFSLIHKESLGDALKQLESENFDLILLDLSLPDEQGLATMFRTNLNAPHIPIIVMSGISDESIALKAVREGAQDYLVKGEFNGHLLARAIRYAIERKRLLMEREQMEVKLQHDTLHDKLTGLPNRILFLDRLDHAIKRAKRTPNIVFAVLFLDLDRFKIINESLGHSVGDQVLIHISQRLKESIRESDTVARFSGDTFTVLLDHVRDIPDAIRVASRIQNAITEPIYINHQPLTITCSIGIALSITGYEKPEDFLRDADIAMYRAKKLGRNRFEVFDATMHARTLSMLQMETDLRQAIEHKEFQVHYQPIISLDRGTIVGFEALARWLHPKRGFVSPAEFIPLAEETGLIIPLGAWILGEACRQIHEWHKQFSHLATLSISVNLSVKQFSQTNLVEEIAQILSGVGLNANHLKLEITESAIMENMELMASILFNLKNIGVQLYLDDFGTGYSSLSYLHQFPINALKIDRSFIGQMNTGSDKEEIVRTIIALAHNLRMNVIAEGVEQATQVEMLRHLHCEYVQGYYFSKPVAANIAGELMSKSPRW